MNWDHTGARSYVEVIPPTPSFNPHTYQDTTPYWPASQADARLKSGLLRHNYITDQPSAITQQPGSLLGSGPGQTQMNLVPSSQRPQLLRTTSLPPVDPSKQLASTPEIHQGAPSPASSQHTPAVTQSVFSPTNPVALQPRPPVAAVGNQNMADPRNSHNQQRPLMGPPETPSRVMQASPNMFPTLQFSPDLFSVQSMGPATAPAYPQQRLFWDQSTPNLEGQHMEQFHNPYQESFDASFHSSSTIVNNYSPVVSQSGTFDLPQQPTSVGPFLDTNNFPMPFQTSPRSANPPAENPTQFLSSPARRFGGHEVPATSTFKRPVRDVPAYHHQIEESRRERELEKKRNKGSNKRADADLIMSSVRRALSPPKSARPGLKRSQTHSGVAVGQQHYRRSNKPSFNDSASASSVASTESSRNGRSSPLKSLRQVSQSSISKARSSQVSRTAMTLAIDEHGVAKTVLQQLPESEDDMDVDDDEQSVVSSADEGDLDILRSQAASFAINEDDDHMQISQASSHFTARSFGGGRLPQDSRDASGPSGGRSNFAMSSNKGDAQKALRAIIEDRSRSVSAQSGYPSSRQSDSSVQFHSSPPVQQNQFADFNASPTTITDPDLATPSTDQESYSSISMTRCICNSPSLDGVSMIQCDSCSKWLHTSCVGVDKRRTSDAYVCVFCEQTPVRHSASRGSVRSSMRGGANSASPLAHKSVRPGRGR